MDDQNAFADFADPDDVEHAPSPSHALTTSAATAGNPFDRFGDPDELPASVSLKAAPAAGFGEAFGMNFRHAAGGSVAALRTLEDERTAGRTDVAQPGDSPFAGKPAQAEVDAARARYAKARQEQEAYDAFRSEGWKAKAGALLGTVFGTLAAPENLIPVGGASTAVGKGLVRTMAEEGAKVGAFSAGTDAARQGLDVASGVQRDFNPGEVAASAAAGAGLGAGMPAVAAGVRAVRARFGASRTAPATPEAPPEPQRAPPAAEDGSAAPDTPAAPGEPVGAPVALPEVVIAAPADRAAQRQAATAAAPIADATLSRITDAIRLVDPTTSADGSLKVPLSIEEAAILRRAGINVDENGVMPATAAAGLLDAQAQRVAAKVPTDEAPKAPTTIEQAPSSTMPDAPEPMAPAPPPVDEAANSARLRAWKRDAQFATVPDLYKGAEANQGRLASAASDIARETGAGFVDPGIKEAGSAERKFATKRYGSAGEMTDVVRGGFKVDTPEQADAVVAGLRQRFDVIDEGWAETPVGYFDRKALVRFDDGQIGEVQIWNPELLDAKETGGGHGLYEVHRSLPLGDPRREDLALRMRDLYAGVRSKLDPRWADIWGDAGNPGNRFSNASRDSTLADIPTSASSTSSHLPPRNAQALPGDQVAGRSSQEQNFGSDIRRSSSPDIGTGSAPRQVGEPVPGIAAHRVSTADGKRIDVAPIVVEARDLRTSADAGYDKALQPRQRDRAASQAQIRDIATNLDPERLGFSAEADRGAPIVGSDGNVESGNGRVLAIRSAYERGGDAAQRYRAWVAAQGVDVSRFREPVIVRQRTTALTPEERRAFTVSANQASTLSMSASERALADSHVLTPERLDLLRNADDLGAAANHEFRRAFVKALPQAEQGAMTAADGSISAEGLTRIRNAVLAAAYGDSPVLARIAEATTDDVKSISNALTAAAPEWARLKADIAAGRVPAEFDLRADLLEAVSRTADIRGKGTKLDSFLAQQDAFDRLPSRVEQWMRMFYDPAGRRAAGAQRITDALRFYAEEARKVSAERGLDLGLKPIRPDEIQGEAYARQRAAAGGPDEPGLFGGRRSDGTGGEAGREEAQGPDARGSGGRDGAAGEPGAGGDVQPLARRGLEPTGFDDASRFPNRQNLAGESDKPRELPADATPQEVQAFRLTDAMRSIAERMGKKLELDGRFTARGALGEYKTKEGVLRIRQEGDTEVFAHELGHAIDQRLANDAATADEWRGARDENATELRRLDANTTDPSKKTVDEGVAEFLRSYVTNPAYARKQAPNTAEAFERILAERDPELGSILADAARMAQIDSGMAPVDVFRTMISPGSQPRGLARFRDEVRRLGMTPTLGLWFDRFTAAIVGPDHWGKRFVDQLREARFQKTGTPLPEFGWSDPYKMLRGLPGAQQAALDSVYHGVRGYGASFKDAPRSPAIYDALAKAFDGHVTLIDRPDDPLVKAFSGYLIARRSRALYERFKAGDLRNPPVRASEAETHAAIAEFERAYPQFASAADDVFAFNQAMLTKKFESGLIGRDVYETLLGRNDDYVPFFRDMADDRAGSGRGTGGAGQERSVIQRMSGSSRQIIDPLHSLIYDAVQTERVIATNDVFKAMHDLAKTGGEFSGRFLERVPNTELRAESVDIAEALRSAANAAGLEKADAETMLRTIENMVGDDLTATVFRPTQTTARGERVAFYWRDGERVALKFGNDEWSKAFFDTVSTMSTSERDLLLAMFGKVNGLFSSLIVDAPQFAIKNLLVDNLSRVFIARNTGALGRFPGASILAGAYTQIFDREFAKAYAALGGHRGGVVAAASRDLAQKQGLGAVTLRPKSIADMKAELETLLRHPKDLAFEIAKSPLTALELLRKAVESTETTGRLGQAKIVFRHLRAQGLDDEEAFRAALYEARDVLDYDRRGSSLYAATKFFVFLNPAVQATERSARSLFGAPFNAAVEAFRRGGYAATDDATKTALADAVRNYGMIALGTVATMGYYSWNADSPVYQRMSNYMRRKYYVFDAGQGEDGRQMVVTVPKPFDHAGGIFAAVEAAMDGLRRGDPQTWSNIRDALLDGFLPRQVSSFQEFMAGNPAIKTSYEAMTGTKLGFDGSKPQAIVPMNLKGLPPEMQINGQTSWIAKKFGQWFGVSPMMADHVLAGMGGTAGKDTSNLLTAAFDNQPNVTMKDAMTRFFFGALYREQKGGGAARSDLMDLMGRDNGSYAVAAAGYKAALEQGDDAQASSIYARANDTGKTLMTLRAWHEFKPEVRQLHPLERTATVGDILSKVTRDLAMSHLEEQDRSRKKGDTRDFIDLEPATARAIANTVGTWAAEEMRNGLTVAREPGYTNFGLIDTAPRLDAIRALSPEVAKEIDHRFKKAKILPIATVARNWPEVEHRLLTDGEKAHLGSLRFAH